MLETCVFCDNPANSDEDILPNWLQAQFPEIAINIQRINSVSIRDGKVHNITRTDVDHPMEFKARIVCTTCNNEWMSRIENKTKPVLAPLLLGQHSTLTNQDQERLVMWFTKLFMVLDGHPKAAQRVFSKDDKRAFMTDKRPSKYLTIALGRYEGWWPWHHSAQVRDEQTVVRSIVMGKLFCLMTYVGSESSVIKSLANKSILIDNGLEHTLPLWVAFPNPESNRYVIISSKVKESINWPATQLVSDATYLETVIPQGVTGSNIDQVTRQWNAGPLQNVTVETIAGEHKLKADND